jgi:hypothetical protein
MLKRDFVTEPIPIIALLFPAEEVDRVAALELGALTLRIKCSLNRTEDKKGKARYKKAQYLFCLDATIL